MKIETLPNVTYSNGATAKKLPDILQEQGQNGAQTQELLSGQSGEVSKEYLDKVVKVANEAFQPVNIGFKYKVDKKTNIEVIEIYNTKTEEIIRQVPPKEILSFLGKMYEMLGILVDKTI